MVAPQESRSGDEIITVSSTDDGSDAAEIFPLALQWYKDSGFDEPSELETGKPEGFEKWWKGLDTVDRVTFRGDFRIGFEAAIKKGEERVRLLLRERYGVVMDSDHPKT